MANTAKALFRGAASLSNTTLYTVPSATTTVVTNIAVTNTTSGLETATLLLNGVELLGTVSVAANTTIVVDLKQTLSATELIEGSASDVGVKFHISGMEIA